MQATSGNISSTDWYSIIRGFQYAEEMDFQGTIAVGETDADIVQAAIGTLESVDEKDDILKVNILVFLQEHSRVLLKDEASLERLFSTFNKIVSGQANSPSGFYFKGQVLSTATAILIELDTAKNNPALFQTFVYSLIEYIRESNTSPDRVLRAQACDCLRELELNYPGLLSPLIGHLYSLCQVESTNALQSYFTLFLTVLENIIGKKIIQSSSVSGVPPSIFSVKDPISSFSVPKGISTESCLDWEAVTLSSISHLPQILLQDIQKSLNLVVDHSHLMNQWGLIWVIYSVERITRALKLAHTILKNNFSGILFSSSPILAHLGFIMALSNSSVYGDLFVKQAIKRVLNITVDVFTIPEMRISSIHWLNDLNPDLHAKYVSSFIQQIYPSAFEMIDIKISKIKLLIRTSSLLQTQIHPKQLIRSFESVSDFRYRAKTSRHALATFNCLFQLVTTSQDTFNQIVQFQLDLITQHPNYIPVLIAFANRVLKDSQPLGLRFLSAYNLFLISAVPSHRIHEYFMLIARVIAEKRINPVDSISFLFEFLKSYAEEGNWELGNQFLIIVRILILRHSPQVIFSQVSELLHYCHTNYADLDIRDRAGYYLTLFTHVHGEKLADFLLVQSSGDGQSSRLVDSHVYTTSTAASKSISVDFLVFSPLVSDKSSCISFTSESFESTGNFMEDYLSMITHEKFVAKINILVRLQYDQKFALEVNTPKQIFALQLEFSPPGPESTSVFYYVPYLTLSDSPDEITKHYFPYSYKMVVGFKPSEPTPGVVGIRCVLTNSDGVTCSGPVLCGLPLRLYDMFVPIYPPPSSESHDRSKAVALVFNYLWENIHTPRWTAHPTRVKATSVFGAESVKVLDVSKTKAQQLIATSLGPFIVEGAACQEKQNPSLICALVFVPPRFHILFQFVLGETSTLTKIRTDSWTLMSHIDVFFQDLLDSKLTQ